MKKNTFVFALIMLICLALPAHAWEVVENLGEVIYHQDFSVISDVTKSGVKTGTLSADDTAVTCYADSLVLVARGGGRIYAILPEFDKGNTYTVEFSFKFDGVTRENGYLSYILTCRGNEPTNISTVVIRGNGTIDDFAPLPDEISSAIASGKQVDVKIPITSGILHRLEISCDDKTAEIVRNSVIVVPSGNVGFSARYAETSISEVYVVSGVGYTEKTGYYSENSYADDDNAAGGDTGDGSSPNTADRILAGFGFLAACSAVAMIICRKKRK
ncbi:MAG: hypothetical protein IJC62_00985 [Clostridia bacterium]|nr:hypothetical protein [Clostridia bacterium]